MLIPILFLASLILTFLAAINVSQSRVNIFALGVFFFILAIALNANAFAHFLAK